MGESSAPLRVTEETPAYWRITFDYPPFNVADGTMFEALQGLLARMDADSMLRVVVFESAIPDFYLSHFDLTGKLGKQPAIRCRSLRFVRVRLLSPSSERVRMFKCRQGRGKRTLRRMPSNS